MFGKWLCVSECGREEKERERNTKRASYIMGKRVTIVSVKKSWSVLS